jgi:2-hydroxychromene-2-carboxylate isomerase
METTGMAKTVEYFLAPQSPWTYLGHARFVEIVQRHGAQVDIKPMDLGKVFGVSGGLPLAKRPPQRQAYRLVELRRWSEFLNMPMNVQPTFFPVPGDPAAKLIIAARLANGTEAALRLAGAVMRGVWAEERNIGDGDTLIAMANACGLEGADLMKSSETASVQGEYERNTEDAIRANVFGSPWYQVEGEGFWGQDRLEFLERVLAK